MDDREKKSFDFAGDVTKQLITLSIGIMTLCIAFTDKIFHMRLLVQILV